MNQEAERKGGVVFQITSKLFLILFQIFLAFLLFGGFFGLLYLTSRIRRLVLVSLFGEGTTLTLGKLASFVGLAVKSQYSIAFIFSFTPLLLAWAATGKKLHAFRALAILIGGFATLVLLRLLWVSLDSIGVL